MKATNEMIAAAQSAHRRMLDKSAWMPADEMRAAIEAALATAPQGEWVMVPREPTREMVASAVLECGDIGAGSCGERSAVDGSDMRAVWDTMIAAAPPCPPESTQPSTEPTTECTTCGATVVRVTGVYDYPPPGDELVRAARAALAALEDILNGWKYIRRSHGDLYGVGWDRAESKAATSIDALRRALDAPEAKGGGR